MALLHKALGQELTKSSKADNAYAQGGLCSKPGTCFGFKVKWHCSI